ncbi:MAG: ketoacyl-ACP synthase III [Chloroflexi bacterium]|nr:ketoacyl-ACP synthase III [Chloroflexota bacterium]MDL1883660.1 ketoacyl-ACP synthase III [Anaerolineae bacterium CFX8]
MRHAQIISTGAYVPERVVTNADLDRILGEPVSDWLIENVGIRERRVMAENQVTSDLAVYAARAALEKAGLKPDAVDLVIVATDTPDYISPGTSSVVQHKLGAKNAGTFDVNCACAAWVTGLDIAARYIATDADYNYILVIGAYGMTRYVDWKDKRTATLFADGAGAVLLRGGEKPGFLGAKLVADGSFHDYLGIYAGGTLQPTGGTPESPRQFVKFVKRFPPDTNNQAWPKLVRDLMTKINRPVSDINKIYFTQLNINTIKYVLSDLGLTMEQTHNIMDKWGYTGSACMPMALDDAVALGKGPQPGELVVFIGSGGGAAFGAAAFEWV